ncbi:hypothetical protein EJ05DRAFT_78716 [Pseudovirgaria hyperparasitica]|uniref:UBA domain-containing protein n=1 Tax=Pseudovirgaria hyperparasitica TaxID=470096 RepID=A0A6A6VZY3_9PEZI|nr:uncharacterized protein EJ05DRAFT_78716 [Pseudovirgaria hyperparasitica]KAF2755815.1 hypothetical protein EJ05DRAFT_78716 [Pseudovirgaria hyperparasitica]
MSNIVEQDKIHDFIAITCATSQEALDHLQASNHDLERAVDMFYSGTLQQSVSRSGSLASHRARIDVYQQYKSTADVSGYDDTAFSSDRYGHSTQDGNIPAFQIDSVDDAGMGYTSTAPTRPPSRVSHRSVDSAMHMVPSSSGCGSTMGISGQESGVLGGNIAPYFGPPTKNHYDTNQWALTIAGPTVSEAIPDVEIKSRKREDDEPAFIKPLASGDYLPALFTILANIPMVRNALICPASVEQNYGHDANWWSGATIHNNGPTLVEEDSPRKAAADFIRETQRLVAFLDGTDRSYGSIDALVRLDAMQNPNNLFGTSVSESESLMAKFLVVWGSSVSLVAPDEAFPHLLYSRVVAPDIDQNVWCMNLQTSDEFPRSGVQTLYDILDEIVFGADEPGDQPGEEAFASISTAAETLVFKIEESISSTKGLSMDIPEHIYMDRYLESNLDATAHMRREMMSHKDQFRKLDQHVESLHSYHSSKSGKTHRPLDLLTAAMQAFRRPTDLEKEVYVEENKSSGQLEHLPISETEHLSITNQLQERHRRIEHRIEYLKARRSEMVEAFNDMSDLLKDLCEDPKRSPSALYHLRGVATQPTIVYVLCDTMDVNHAGQWWRLEFSHVNSPTSSIKKRKVNFGQVQAAIQEECRTALLVYASKNATEADLLPLPTALQEFVTHDNTLFEDERATMVTPSADWDDSARGLQTDVDWDYNTDRNWGATYNISSVNPSSITADRVSSSDTEMTEDMAAKSRSSEYMDKLLKQKMGEPGDKLEAFRTQYIEEDGSDVKRQRMSVDST